MVRQGFAERLPRLRAMVSAGSLRHALDEYEPRLAYEIEMIKRMRYAGYFLIVWDFIRYAREQGIPVGPGRGSAAGSLVAFCLRITDVDPLQYDLIFERFLNPERVSLPDIDIDFCERRRGEVIEYVTRKYGRENVAQIITFGTMKAKAAVRDVARALDIPLAEANKVAKLIPRRARHDHRQGRRGEPGAEGAREGRPQGRGTAPRRAPARRHGPPRVDARRRRRHRAGADHRLCAALQGRTRRNRHPVGDEGDRARRSPEDGLPGAEHAHADPGRACRDHAHDRHAARHRHRPARRPEDVRAVRRRPDLRRVPVRELRACGRSSARPSLSGSTT